MQIGSTQLPLTSLVTNRKGSHLAVKITARSQLRKDKHPQHWESRALLAALARNTSVRVLSLSALEGRDVVRVRPSLDRDSVRHVGKQTGTSRPDAHARCNARLGMI